MATISRFSPSQLKKKTCEISAQITGNNSTDLFLYISGDGVNFFFRKEKFMFIIYFTSSTTGSSSFEDSS